MSFNFDQCNIQDLSCSLTGYDSEGVKYQGRACEQAIHDAWLLMVRNSFGQTTKCWIGDSREPCTETTTTTTTTTTVAEPTYPDVTFIRD